MRIFRFFLLLAGLYLYGCATYRSWLLGEILCATVVAAMFFWAEEAAYQHAFWNLSVRDAEAQAYLDQWPGA